MARPTQSLGQRSLDDLGTALHQVTFCVLDLETTGGSPATSGITEIGAVRLRGGEPLGTFSTLVDPGMPIPREIVLLTGITDGMVAHAPSIGGVLPSLLEFIGTSVVVGHNVRFDLGFINAALERSDRPKLPNTVVDTLALARRLVRDEVPNCKLGTLATRLGLVSRPSHRALDDALATGELLHVLLERAAGLGVTGLDDLVSLPRITSHPYAAKLRLTEALPRGPGVYMFRGDSGQVLYVGKAANLRARVRSYFSSDDRRKVSQLIKQTHSIDHITCLNDLEAAVAEIRLVQLHQPRFNSQLKRWRGYTYLRLDKRPRPRLVVSRTLSSDTSALQLGPFSSARVARLAAAAIELVSGLGSQRPAASDHEVSRLEAALTSEPALLLDPLASLMAEHADAERYEDAAAVRDMASALAAALDRRRRLSALRGAGRIVVEEPEGGGAAFEGGLLADVWDATGASAAGRLPALARAPHCDPSLPPDREHIDELLTVVRWLERRADRLRLKHADSGWSFDSAPLPLFAPAAAGRTRLRGLRFER